MMTAATSAPSYESSIRPSPLSPLPLVPSPCPSLVPPSFHFLVAAIIVRAPYSSFNGAAPLRPPAGATTTGDARAAPPPPPSRSLRWLRLLVRQFVERGCGSEAKGELEKGVRGGQRKREEIGKGKSVLRGNNKYIRSAERPQPSSLSRGQLKQQDLRWPPLQIFKPSCK